MKKRDFYGQMLLQEEDKRSCGDESTADLYRAVRNHFICFSGGKELSLKEVTPALVEAFLKWLREKGLRVNTVNSYMSNLRAMYNRARRESKEKRGESPFAGIHLRQEETRKRAVPVEVIKEIAALDLKSEPKKQLAIDLALFSFMACGIPFVDIVHLTGENLVENGTVLQYHRQKTGAFIQMEVTSGMQMLIDRYKDEERRYLFPVLPEDATHEQYKSCLATENRYLKEISVMLDLPETLTTYSFRHAWASEAYRLHVAIGVISQALGHTSEKTTRIYLQKFDVSEIAKANRQVSEAVGGCLRVG
ncbi:tyrosine-type recombinase/integrase [Parabacteroides chongii]|uniref:tyrosine-type recombinase/integrase n=1 Tax=Parabacteroides chongii TaxID=2685834 RepID=UPI00240DCD7F|nr:site-specific integrase [Parabacteroides chongii]WFE83273.1 site-specific integrase [Parabacteroides chongii]